jgi:hypothetical protein
MPIRSPRRFYKVNVSLIKRDNDDAPDVVDKLPGDTTPQTTRAIVVKMKEGIGDYFGLTPAAWDDPIFNGVFKGNGLNKGANFRRNIGGYKDAAYTLIANELFSIKEKYYDKDLLGKPVLETPTTKFKTITIGFPVGHSVNEVIKWLATLDNFDTVLALRTPAGKRHDLYKPN